MKKNLLLSGLFAVALACGFTSCGDDDDDPTPTPDPDPTPTVTDPYKLQYADAKATAWGNYMQAVAQLLQQDATTLYDDWTSSFNGGDSYAEIFRCHDDRQGYGSALNCVETLIEGAADIANEVGESKIGDPISKYEAGQTQDALYAVESWFSWHSRDDYRNNIFSIRNVYYGNVYSPSELNVSIQGATTNYDQVDENSLSALLARVNPDLDNQVKTAIKTAADAIYAIPQPFRNNINSTEAKTAQSACGALEDLLTNTLLPYFRNNANVSTDALLDPIVTRVVNAVILPTYENLKDLNTALNNAVTTFRESPSDANFQLVANAWLDARVPWESSEAYLWGPVADKGLDPNMDSWPLDVPTIEQVLNSETWNTAMNWTGEFNENDEKIAAAQNVRGFHTLEFLTFYNGNPRSVTAHASDE